MDKAGGEQVTRPPKKKRGVVVTVSRRISGVWADVCLGRSLIYGQCVSACYASLSKAGLKRLKPGETRTVRLVIEEE